MSLDLYRFGRMELKNMAGTRIGREPAYYQMFGAYRDIGELSAYRDSRLNGAEKNTEEAKSMYESVKGWKDPCELRKTQYRVTTAPKRRSFQSGFAWIPSRRA